MHFYPAQAAQLHHADAPDAGLMLIFELLVFFPAHLAFSCQFHKFLRAFEAEIRAK